MLAGWKVDIEDAGAVVELCSRAPKMQGQREAHSLQWLDTDGAAFEDEQCALSFRRPRYMEYFHKEVMIEISRQTSFQDDYIKLYFSETSNGEPKLYCQYLG